MKNLLFLLLPILFILPGLANAAFPTQSANLTAASSQSFSAADSTSLSITGDQTHEGWYKFSTLPSSGNGMNLISKYNPTGSQRGLSVVYENSAGTYRFHVRTSANGSTVSEGTVNYTLSTNTWYYLRFVYRASAGEMDFYVDNLTTPVGTEGALTGSIFDNTAPYRIGANTEISGNFDGKISVVRVWSNQHTANDKCTVYGSAQTNMAAEWSLDNVLTDASGNGNTLTNNNSATFGVDVPVCVSSNTFNPYYFWDF